MRNRILLGALLLMLVLIVSCAAPVQRDYSESPRVQTSDSSVVLWIDREAGVACWIYVSYGISCLPLDQTALPQ